MSDRGKVIGRAASAAARAWGGVRRLLGRRRVKALLLANGAVLLALLALGLALGRVAGAPQGQQAARAWRNGLEDARYAQVSLFVSDRGALSFDGVMGLRDKLDAKLKENSLEPRVEGARLWIDAFSAARKLSVSRGGGGQVEATATGVGGDYFYFHEFELMYGQLLQGDEVMKDLVVIDDLLAWRLYGAFDVVGFTLEVGGQKCYVAGVVRHTESWPGRKTYGEFGRMFMAWEMLEQIGPSAGITCYEAVLPDPVTGFAAGLVEAAATVEPEERVLVENSARFGTLALLKKAGSLAGAGVQTQAVALPYWENAARLAENAAALLLALMLLLAVFPLVCLGILLVLAWRRKGRAWHAARAAFERWQMERWRRRNPEPQPAEEGREETPV